MLTTLAILWLIVPQLLTTGNMVLLRRPTGQACPRQVPSARIKSRKQEQGETRLMITDQQEEDALQSYFDHIVDLLLNYQLRASQPGLPGDEARRVAGTLTFTTLRRLGADRKGTLVRFLHDAELLSRNQTIVDLDGADLSNANLSGADLDGSFLVNATLSGANLSNANLSGSDLGDANLSGADLGGASLFNADLSGATLSGATLSGATLNGANLGNVNLSGADLSSADLETATLSGADLKRATLIDADLKSATLNEADLNGAELSGADLSFANLTGAQVTQQQLAQSKSLSSATMPDGSIHP